MNNIILAITGASGVQYALNLLKALTSANYHIYLLISDAALQVIKIETDLKLPTNFVDLQDFFIDFTSADNKQITLCHKNDWLSAPASGSANIKQMIIAPCSMGTISALACGASNNLIERAADVIIKERHKLIIMPRETPLSSIHLQNMLTLSSAGAIIMPACPGFYGSAKNIDDLFNFMTAKVFNLLDIPQKILPKWGN